MPKNKRKLLKKFIKKYYKMFILVILSFLLGVASLVLFIMPFVTIGTVSYTGFDLVFTNPDPLVIVAFALLVVAIVLSIVFAIIFFATKKNGLFRYVILSVSTLSYAVISFMLFYLCQYINYTTGSDATLTLASILSSVFTLSAFVLNIISLLYVSSNKDVAAIEINESEDIDI